MDEKRVTRQARELAVSDWIWSGDDMVQIVTTEPFRDNDGPGVFLAWRLPDGSIEPYHAEPEMAFTLVSDEERAKAQELAERARKIADIRALADWLEANPEIPMAYGIGGQADFSESVSYSAAEIDAVRAFAEKHGGEFRQGKDHTSARIRFGGVTYSLISWHKDGRPAEPAPERVDPTGLAYSRADDEPDDPTPVSGARVAPHVGAVTEQGLVDETPVSHQPIGGSAGGPGENSAECDCGVVFDTIGEANEQLGLHIEAATSPTGLTKVADESRGALAFTTPVVTYFSFGHGQTDPDSGQSLLDHYVTVVAPTYEACREAMFASRFGREWSFDYLAGTKQATEWIARWTEHEVIVAPGTDPAGVEKALTAAADLLLVGE